MATFTVAGSSAGNYHEIMNLDNNTTYVVKIIASAKKLNSTVLTVTLYDDASVKILQDKLIKLLKAAE